MSVPNMEAFPKPYIIEPESKYHEYTIILLHGRASSGHEFANDFFEGRTSAGHTLKQQLDDRGVKWVFPSAHERFSSVFQEDMTEWFDIKSLSDPEADSELQKEGLRESICYISSIIDRELKRIPARNVVLGGISQGFAVAIHTLLSRKETFGGFIGMSGWLPFQTAVERSVDATGGPLADLFSESLATAAKTHPNMFGTPVWISHSEDDAVVECALGMKACSALKNLGMSVEFHEHGDGGHWLAEPAGYDELLAFLSALLKHD